MTDPLGRHSLGRDPLALLALWVDEARAAGWPAPNAMTLATADGTGTPHARTVLVTGIDGTALRFHSSAPTGKTADLAENPRVSGVFLWPLLGRQVVVHGTARELDASVSRAAFGTRPRQLQLIAWAYDELLPELRGPDRAIEAGAVERAVEAVAATTAMPPSWTTIEVVPEQIDIWQAGTEHTPPTRTRFVLDGSDWRSFPVLP